MVAVHLHDGALRGGGRHPEPVPHALDYERRHGHGVELVQPARRRGSPGAARGLQGEGEAQLVLVSEKLGLTFTESTSSVPAEVVELARTGNKLRAMTRYKELTGASTDEARDIVVGL